VAVFCNLYSYHNLALDIPPEYRITYLTNISAIKKNYTKNKK